MQRHLVVDVDVAVAVAEDEDEAGGVVAVAAAAIARCTNSRTIRHGRIQPPKTDCIAHLLDFRQSKFGILLHCRNIVEGYWSQVLNCNQLEPHGPCTVLKSIFCCDNTA